MVNEQSIGNHLEAKGDSDERPCDLINRNFAFANGAQLNTSANPRQNEDIRPPPAENVHIVIVNRTLLYLAAAIVLVSFFVTTTSFILTVTTIPGSSDCSTFSTGMIPWPFLSKVSDPLNNYILLNDMSRKDGSI